MQNRHLILDDWITPYQSVYVDEARNEEDARLWYGDNSPGPLVGHGWTYEHVSNRPGLDIFLGECYVP